MRLALFIGVSSRIELHTSSRIAKMVQSYKGQGFIQLPTMSIHFKFIANFLFESWSGPSLLCSCFHSNSKFPGLRKSSSGLWVVKSITRILSIRILQKHEPSLNLNTHDRFSYGGVRASIAWGLPSV